MRKRARFIMIVVAVAFVAGFLLSELWQMIATSGRRDDPRTAGQIGQVGDHRITPEEYRNAVSYTTEKYREENQLRDLSIEDYARIEDRAWDFLVSELTWSRLLRESGIKVTETEIIEIMKANPPADLRQNPELLDESGNFDQQKYLEVMNNPQNQPYFARYFQELVEMLPKEKFRINVVNSWRPTRAELEDALSRQATRWTVTALYFGPRVIEQTVEPTDDEALAFYRANQDEFKTREVRQARYVFFPLGQSARDSADAQETIDRAAAQLESGESFNLTMLDFSDLLPETTSALIPRERLDDITDSVVGALKPGEHSQPFLAPYGWQLVRLDSLRADSVALRRILVRVKMGGEAVGEAREAVRDFIDRATASDFDSVATDMGLVVRPARPMLGGKENLAGLDLASPTQYVEWLKKAKPGEVWDMPARGRNGFYAFQLTEVRPARLQPFEEVKQQAAWRVRQERERGIWLQLAKEARAAIGAGTTLEDYAAAHPAVELQQESFEGLIDARRRRGADYAGALLALAPGQLSQVVEAPWGAFIIRADAVEQAPGTSLEQLAQQRQQQVVQQLMQELVENPEVKDYRDPFSF